MKDNQVAVSLWCTHFQWGTLVSISREVEEESMLVSEAEHIVSTQ